MGALRDVTEIVEDSGPEVARRLQDEGVDVVANSMRLHAEDQFSRSHLIREAGRCAWPEHADSQVMRQMLDAGPVPYRAFCGGDCLRLETV